MANPKLWFGRHLSGRLLYDKRKQRKKLAREISRKIYARQRVYDRIMMQGYARTVSHSLMKGGGAYGISLFGDFIGRALENLLRRKKITVPPARCTVI